MRYILAAAVAVMLAVCQPAYALACDQPWAPVEAQIKAAGFTIIPMEASTRKEVGDWYNQQPPTANYDYDLIAFVSGDGPGGLIFVSGGCLRFVEVGMTPDKLMLLMSRNKS